tara:strand:- start:55 stop:267 length:213 start_codon:yes stop_codon:yes gene_type:complete
MLVEGRQQNETKPPDVDWARRYGTPPGRVVGAISMAMAVAVTSDAARTSLGRIGQLASGSVSRSQGRPPA